MVDVLHSSLIALDDDNFAVASVNDSSTITIHVVTQAYIDDNWSLTTVPSYTVTGTRVLDFQKLDMGYVLVYEEGDVKITRLDDDFVEVSTSSDYLDYVNEVYNRSDSLTVLCVAVDTAHSEVVLGGYISSFGERFSFVMGVDTDNLSPTWLRVYQRGGQVIAVVPTAIRDFIALQSDQSTNTTLVVDNQQGTALQVYDVDLSGQSIATPGLHVVDDKEVILSVTNDQFGSIFSIDFSSESAVVAQVKNYQLSSTALVIDQSRRMVVAGTSDLAGQSAFVSELSASAALWCNNYFDADYLRVLDIVESPGKGFVMAFVVSTPTGPRLHLVRTDEEGATRTNDFSENC